MPTPPKVLPQSLSSALIAPCGMDCGLCRAHLRERDRCPGCNGDDSAKPGYCITCKIKTCPNVASASMAFCSGCDDMPCARLRQLDKRYRAKYGMSMLENLREISETGVAAFVAHERQKWECPECGGLICVHKPDCLYCGRTWNAKE